MSFCVRAYDVRSKGLVLPGFLPQGGSAYQPRAAPWGIGTPVVCSLTGCRIVSASTTETSGLCAALSGRDRWFFPYPGRLPRDGICPGLVCGRAFPPEADQPWLAALSRPIVCRRAQELLGHASLETTMVYPVTTLSRGTGLTWHARGQGAGDARIEPVGPATRRQEGCGRIGIVLQRSSRRDTVR